MLRDQGVAGSNPSKESDVKGAPIAVPDLHLLGVGRLVRVLGSGLSRQSVTRIRLLEVLLRRELGIAALQVRWHVEREASGYFRKGVPSFQ